MTECIMNDVFVADLHIVNVVRKVEFDCLITSTLISKRDIIIGYKS